MNVQYVYDIVSYLVQYPASFDEQIPQLVEYLNQNTVNENEVIEMIDIIFSQVSSCICVDD